MRRLILGCLVLGGCTKENPAWGNSAGDGVDTGSDSGGSSVAADVTSASAATTGDPAPTDGSASASGDETTGALIMSTGGETATGEATTGGTSTSTGEEPGTSTGAPAKTCLAWETIPLPLPAVHDTGVVPDSLNDAQTCPWGGQTCGELNFGTTEFYRLVNDVNKGRNSALLRFPVTSLADVSKTLGYSLDDLVGVRISVVFWENTSGPTEPYTLEIRSIRPENLGWTEGGRNATPAQEGDSSDNCRTVQGECKKWQNGEPPLQDSEPLGVIDVDAAKVVDADMDGLGDQYHAPILSERLEGALKLYGHDVMPSYGLRLKTIRNLDQTVVGIKFKEVQMWDDPTLHGDYCTQWSE